MVSEVFAGSLHLNEIALVGGLTLENISQVKDEIVRTLSPVRELSINLENVDGVDVAGIQLLCACHRFATGRGKRIFLAGVQKNIEESVKKVGFAKSYACPSSKSSEPCLWAIISAG